MRALAGCRAGLAMFNIILPDPLGFIFFDGARVRLLLCDSDLL